MEKGLTDAEVEIEIKRLEASDAVKLARKEQRILYKRRQRMYTLRFLEKRGLELMKLGVSLDDLDCDEDGECEYAED